MPFQWFNWCRGKKEIPATDIEAMLAATAQHEGGWSNEPEDPGGQTMCGITIETYRAYYKNPNLTGKDLIGITREEADTILLNVYFLRPKLNLLSGRVAPQVFDISVNSGPMQAVKILQRACNDLKPRTARALSTDGLMGPKTAERANSTPYGLLNDRIVERRLAFYEDLIEKNPELKVFRNGWRRRAESYRTGAKA